MCAEQFASWNLEVDTYIVIRFNTCVGCLKWNMYRQGRSGLVWRCRVTDVNSRYILEGIGIRWSRTEGGGRGRGPVTSRATLSTDLGQRDAWFIYMQVMLALSAWPCADCKGACALACAATGEGMPEAKRGKTRENSPERYPCAVGMNVVN